MLAINQFEFAEAPTNEPAGVFPNGNELASASGLAPGEVNPAEAYAAQINKAWGGSVEAVLSVAKLIASARAELEDHNYRRLAELLEMSAGTLSKFIKIDAHHSRFEPLKHILSADWTKLYLWSCMPDEKFNAVVASGKLRRDLTAKEMANLSDSSSAKDRDRDETSLYRVLAIAKIPFDIPSSVVRDIENTLRTALQGQPVHWEFPENKKEHGARLRASLAPRLKDQLNRQLAERSPDVTWEDYELLKNAAWQFQHKQQKDKFPYAASEKRSVTHPEHPYGCNKYRDRSAFFQFMKSKRVVTVYSALPDFAGLGEARCIKYAYDYCTATSEKARRSSKQRLTDVASKEPELADAARRYLNIIDGREVI